MHGRKAENAYQGDVTKYSVRLAYRITFNMAAVLYNALYVLLRSMFNVPVTDPTHAQAVSHCPLSVFQLEHARLIFNSGGNLGHGIRTDAGLLADRAAEGLQALRFARDAAVGQGRRPGTSA